ncbi:MAG: cohesin domain-containing protein [Clostridia bacterium]|nr:cohesin domain-containing protein [Clostridia bacterium]
MHLKRTLCALLTALLLLGTVFCTALAAHDPEDRIIVTVAEVNAVPGKQVTVPVYIDNALDMDSIQFRLDYDLTTLKLVKAEIGDALNNDGLYVINDDDEGLVAFAYANAQGLTQAGGEALRLTFSQFNDHGSAIVLSKVFSSRYDPKTDIQTKVLTDVRDGGVSVGEGGTIPAPVTTPWAVETPVPTPAPTPAPTPEPTATPVPTPVPTPEPTPKTFGTVVSDWFGSVRAQMGATAERGFSFEMLVPVLLLLIAIVVVVLAIVLVLSNRKSSKKHRKNDEE